MTAIAPDLSAVLDRIVDGVTVQDEDGRLVYANAVAARRLGFATPEDLLQSDPAVIAARYVMFDQHGEPLPWDQLPGRLVLAGQESAETLVRFRDLTTDAERWAMAHATALTTQGGSRFAVNVVRDVTAQINAEMATREREARVEALLAALPDLMFVQAPDSTYLEYHAADDTQLYASPSDFLGKKSADVLPPEMVATVMPALTHTALTGELTTVEYTLPFANEKRHFESRMVRLDEERVLSIVRDLTDRYRAEAALEEQRHFAERLAATIPSIIYVYDLVLHRNVYVNNGVERVLGYRPDDVENVAWDWSSEQIHPEDQKRLPELLAKVEAAEDGEIVEVTLRFRHANGRWCWLTTHLTVMTRTASGRPHLVVGSAVDNTAQLESAEAQRQSEERYRAVVDSQTEMICRYLPGSATITFVNDANCRAAGRPREDLLGRSLLDLAPASDRARMATYFAALAADPRTAEIEHQVDLPDGSVGWEHWVDTPIYDPAGRLVEFQGVGRDVTDLRRTEEALRKSEERYRAVVDSQTELICRFLPDSTLTFVNDAYCRFFGRTRDELIGTKFLELDPESSHDYMRERLEVILQSSGPVLSEHEMFMPDGTIGHMEWSDVAIHDEHGVVVEAQGIGRDVTDLRRAEEALRKSELHYREVVNLQTDLVSRYLPDSTLTFVNDAYCQFFSRSRDELIGTRFLDHDPPWTHETTLARLKSVADSLEPTTFEQEEFLPDGSAGWFQWANRAIRDDSGTVIELQGVGRDVTALRRTEQALQASEARYRDVLDLQTDLVCRYLPDTTLTFVNDAYCRFFGLKREELIGKQFLDLIPSSTHDYVRDWLARIMESDEPVTSEHEMFQGDRVTGPMQWIDRAIRDVDGLVTEIQGVGRDVTDLRQTEAALAEQRRFADRVAAASPDILYVFDVIDSRTVYANDAIGRVLGYSAEQLTDAEATDPMAMRHPDDREAFLAAVAQVSTAADGEVIEFPFRMRHVNGSWRWLAARITVLTREPNGRPRLVVGAALDVTALREAEQALRESEARYRDVVNLQTDLVSRYLPDSTLTFVNDAYCRFMGRSREELIGTRFIDLIPSSAQDYVRECIRRIVESQEPVSTEHEMYVRDGELGAMHWVDRAIRDAEGVVVEIQGVGRDVTALRRVEDALRTSETQLRLAIDNASIGTWDWSIEPGWIAWSERTGTLYGLPAHTTGVTLETFLSLIHPDDRKRVDEETLQRIADGADYAVEYRVIWPDGSLHWLERRGRAIAFNGEGRPSRFLGVTIDVTDLKQSETTLRELTQRLMSSQDDERRRLARELHDGMAQDVFAMTMALASLENTDPPMEGGPPAALTAARRLAEQVLRGLRTRSYLLHPPLLDLSGLAAALREYADGLNKHGGLAIDTTLVEDVGRLPEDVETALFRVAQEALSNVARHAGTTRAALTLTRDEEAVELSVADTGKGLAKEAGQKAPTIGVGIAGMRERLSQIGGRLDIHSGRGGTTVTARVPAALGTSSTVSRVP